MLLLTIPPPVLSLVRQGRIPDRLVLARPEEGVLVLALRPSESCLRKRVDVALRMMDADLGYVSDSIGHGRETVCVLVSLDADRLRAVTALLRK